MRPALRRLFLRAVATDRLAVAHAGAWETRCLHCRRRLHVSPEGDALDSATLEHVVPRAWFGKRAAADLTARVCDDPDDARNLAVACAGCNHGKGMSHDARGPDDARARTVIERLLATRLERWRAPAPERDPD